MQIETKYNIGKKLYFYSHGKLLNGKVVNIKISCNGKQFSDIEYSVLLNNIHWLRKETEVYPTKAIAKKFKGE